MRRSRRDLLLGLGAGALLCGPWLRRIRTVDAAPGDRGNFMFFYTPNGFLKDEWGADGTVTSYSFRPSLAVLEEFKQKITVIHGLNAPSASQKASHEDVSSILVGRPRNGYQGTGASFDHVLAEHFSSRPLTLGVEIDPQPNWQRTLSWKAAGAADPHNPDPQGVFAELFRDFAPTTDPEEIQRLIDKRQSMLDFIRDDLTSFQSRLSGSEREKLELHLSSLRTFEQLAAAPGPSCSVGSKDELGAAIDQGQPGDPIERLRHNGELQMRITALAFSCGLRRVGTLLFQPASGGINPSGQGGENHHGVTHWETGKQTPDIWHAIDRWYADRFAFLMAEMSRLQVLDETIVIWGSEISQGHDQQNMHWLVAGGSNVGIQNGKFLEFPVEGDQFSPGNASNQDLYVSVQRALGLNSDTFGEPKGVNGPLPGIT